MDVCDFVSEGRPGHWRSTKDGMLLVTRTGQSVQELLDELAQGSDEITSFAPITPLQARRALSQAGMRQAVEDWVVTQSLDAQDAWHYATEIRRDDPMIAAAASALNLSDTAVDDLFVLAAGL